MALPEQWSQQPVTAGQANVDLTTLVSTSFDTIKAIRAGSIVGLATRFSNAITAGTATVAVTINGAATAVDIVHTSVSNPTGGSTVEPIGSVPYVADDLIGVEITTDVAFAAGLLPAIEAWVEVFEPI